MPKSENLDRLGSIAFILGNKELPSEISKEDYYNYKSIFSDETVNSGDSLVDTKISKDDKVLAELQANDSGISDREKEENERRRKEIEEQLKNELSQNDKEKILKPEDILSTLSEENKKDIAETKDQKEKPKEDKVKRETKAERIAREEAERLRKEDLEKKKVEAIKADKEKKELDDLDALLGSLDDIFEDTLFEDEKKAEDVVESIKEDNESINPVSAQEENKSEEDETPIDEIVEDRDNNNEDDHIEVNIDDIDNEKNEENESINSPKNIVEEEKENKNTTDDDLDIDDLLSSIEPPKAINENYDQVAIDDNKSDIDDLDSILEEFNNAIVEKSQEELEKELDKEIEEINRKAPPKVIDETLNDLVDNPDLDDLDSILQEFNDTIKDFPKEEQKEEQKKEENNNTDINDDEQIEDNTNDKTERIENKESEEESNNNITIPSLDDIEEEVEDIIANDETKAEDDNNNNRNEDIEDTEDTIADNNEKNDETEETTNDELSNISKPVKEEYSNLENEDEKPLPPPNVELTDSKYGTLSGKYNNDKILKTIEKLPEGIQFSVLDAILNEKLSDKDMDSLLSLLEKNASPQKISNLLTGNVITPKSVIDNTKKAIDLIPVPNSLKEYAGIIRYAAIFIVGLIAVSILGYQFVYKPLRANSYFETGLKAVEKGNYDTGELNFNRGDRLKPKQIKWYNEYAKAYMDKDRFDDAYNKIDMSLKVSPNDFESKIVLGDYYRRRAENDLDTSLYTGGEKLYDDMLLSENAKNKKSIIFDKRGLLMMSRANTLHDKAYLKNAYDNYQTMLKNDGDKPSVRKRMMQVRIYEDDYEQVKLLRTYINTIKKGYFDDDVYPLLARYLLYKDDFHSARTIFEDVLKKYRDSIPAIVGYAEYETRLKHYDKARNILVNAALPLYEERKITKGKEFVYNLLGQIYYNLSQYGNATREFLNALALNPTYPDANYNLGNVYFYQENNYPKAKMYYQTAYTNAPKELLDDKLIYNLSWIHYLDKKYDRAFEGFLNLFNRESDNVVVSYALANSLMHLDKDVLARGFYNNALNHILEKRNKLGKLEMRTEKEFALVNYMASLYNNLGVSYAYTYTRERKVLDEQESFKNFVLASQYFDQIRTSNIDLQKMEKRTITLGSQNIAIPTYNVMTMQTRRNLKDNLAIDDYIPKLMNSLK